jgi:hypothetical protein
MKGFKKEMEEYQELFWSRGTSFEQEEKKKNK